MPNAIARGRMKALPVPQAHPDKVLDIKGFYICVCTHGGEEDEERKDW